MLGFVSTKKLHIKQKYDQTKLKTINSFEKRFEKLRTFEEEEKGEGEGLAVYFLEFSFENKPQS